MPPVADLPRWSLTAFFPAVDSPEFQAAVTGFQADVAGLVSAFDEDGIGQGPTTGDHVAMFERHADALNRVLDQARLVRGYLHGFVTTDSRDEAAQAEVSRLAPTMTRLSVLNTRFTAWIGTLPVEELIAASPMAADHAYPLRKMKESAARLMAPELESLAAELAETGGGAWSRLYGNFTSQLQVPIDGGTMAMSQVRNLAFDPDPVRRRAGYSAELAAWKSSDLVIAAAMNSIKGEAKRLAARRGWDSLLALAVFDADIDRPTLDAMMAAAQDAFPVFRRYLRAKARLLGGTGGLHWADMFAPVGQDAPWAYDRGVGFIESKFRDYTDSMADYADRAFRGDWIDAEPRPGKRDGAFCMGLRGDESRILMNYKPAFGSVSTLAHELGHGYHNLCLSGRTALQRQVPMTLAETASIFCETIIKRAALREGDATARLSILEASLQGACQVVVDITSRFLFEQEVVDRRGERELSADELCDAMRRAQLATYGDGLDPAALHPYMWAVKPHYYAYRSFYNFPYMFGLLFGLGLYAVYSESPGGFPDRYDALLAGTGSASAADLAAEFGIDIKSQGFWAGSLAVLAQDVSDFESLASAH